MVFGEAATSQNLAARSPGLDPGAGRVHEHQIERAEEIAPPREQVLLDDVLQATRREGRGPVLLILGQFLAEPGHRPIEVMQVEALDALDPVILPPAVRRPVRAAAKQPMQNGQDHRALQRKIMPAELARFSTTSRQPVSSHKRSKTSAGPMRRAVLVVASPAATRRRQWLWRRSGRPSAAAAPIARCRANPRPVRA